MPEQQNLQLARESIEAWSAHDPSRLAKIVDEKFVAESDTLPARINGSEELAQFMSVYVTAFPDLHFEIGVHDWIYWDSGNLLRQLGVLPGSK